MDCVIFAQNMLLWLLEGLKNSCSCIKYTCENVFKISTKTFQDIVFEKKVKVKGQSKASHNLL